MVLIKLVHMPRVYILLLMDKVRMLKVTIPMLLREQLTQRDAVHLPLVKIHMQKDWIQILLEISLTQKVIDLKSS